MRFCLQGVENQSRKKHRNVCVKTRMFFRKVVRVLGNSRTCFSGNDIDVK